MKRYRQKLKEQIKLKAKLYIPSTINTDHLHTLVSTFGCEGILVFQIMVQILSVYITSVYNFFIKGGAFNAVMDQSSVFGHNRDKGVNEGKSRL